MGPHRSDRARLRCSALIATLTLASSATAAQTPSYSVLQIGPLPGHSGSFPDGIDNRGRVIGWSNTVAAFLFDGVNLAALPALVSGSPTHAEGLVDTGVVLGSAGSVTNWDHAVAWFPAAGGFTVLDLGVAPGDIFSGAVASGAGTIAGYSDDGFNPQPVAWLPQASPPGSYALQALPFYGGDFAGGATGVDAVGRVYGWTSSFGPAHAVRWRPVSGGWSVADLGALTPGVSAEVMDAAPNGLAVGYSQSPTTLVEHAVAWGTGGVVDLGSLNPGWRAIAQGVNAQGDIVGKSGPFTYDAGWVRLASIGTIVDLNSRLPAGSPWVVSSATDIADDGRIVATGARGNSSHTVLLTPVSAFFAGPTPGIAGQTSTVSVSAATPGGTVQFVWSRNGGGTSIAGCPSIGFDLQQAQTIGSSVADSAGNASLNFLVPGSLAGSTVLFQAFDAASCRVTNVSQHAF
jgi:hypothetical protein